MTIHRYLMTAVKDDARRAGERDRVFLEARRARIAGRQHARPAALASRLARMLWRRAPDRKASRVDRLTVTRAR